MLKQRVLTAIVLIIGFLAALFLSPSWLWLAVVVLVSAVAAHEWSALSGFGQAGQWGFVLSTSVLCAGLGVTSGHVTASSWPGLLVLVYGLSALFWCGLALPWMLGNWSLQGKKPWRAVLTGWLVLLPPALALLHLRDVSPWLLLAAMALVWVADSAAFFVGRRFGRIKLAPAISPGKTREGAYGALAGVLLYGLLVYWLSGFQGLALPVWLLCLPVLTVLSIVGDLFESLMKRQAGVKDSGKLLPGHGGVLDRIDSLTSTLPLVGLLVLWGGV